ncbi:CBS domain-containing protein [Nocardioides sp. CER19]|uniref:CBS domain-containing protein n=1 Tax=Nocardioides sp. CER19 TaxID=3038538 RepID=UPI00244D1DB5|nr:CBS domain-containing protein [Nocardioides sp. CER19]MDH2415327.1 CBS domain-containing protein [Nocardioides sp. CER19]
MHISEVLARKPSGAVVTVTPETTIRQLLGVLAEHNIGACVVYADDAIQGIVSERDIVRRLHADGPAVAVENSVGAIMTTEVTVCSPADAVEEILGVMTERRIRHLPVVEHGELLGIVSIGDLVKHRIDQLTFERDQLEGYVHQH